MGAVKLGSLIGRPLQVDATTLNLKRLVEVDVAKCPVPRIWIGDDDCGHWQKVEYEEWPNFCSFCEKVGHLDNKCYRKHLNLKTIR